MVIYRFDRKPGSKVPGYINPYEGKISNFLKELEFLSTEPEYEVNGVGYYRDARTGIFYPFSEKDLKRSECIECVLIPQCRNGIDIFDAMHEERQKLDHVERGGKIILTMDFNTDKPGNIWARVFLLNDDLSYRVENGYIIYKNIRNNFANVAIPNWKYTTVLTAGEVDRTKVEEAKKIAPQSPVQTFALQTRAKAKAATKASTSNLDTKTLAATRQKVSTANAIKSASTITRTYAQQVSMHGPQIVQNSAGFPPVAGYSSSRKVYEYNYALNYTGFIANMEKIYANHNLDLRSITANTAANLERYNRFKLAYPDDMLSRGFMHIFFTRPDCNFLNASGSLESQVKYNPYVKYMDLRNPKLLRQLVQLNGSNHQFMMLLSNKAKAFPLSDDGVNAETHGKSRGGYSIAFGRRRDSEVGGTININYKDTRNLDIISLHKLWADYIVNVYQGTWVPKMQYINQKILDYAVACYVIVTAEDFETIIFWSKYYGIFPVSVPYSSLSWDGDGTTVKAPDLSVTYRYSWKEDLNPLALLELNMNAFKDNVPNKAKYIPTFNTKIARIDKTWTGAPFVETVKYRNNKKDPTDGSLVSMKLRFRPA